MNKGTFLTVDELAGHDGPAKGKVLALMSLPATATGAALPRLGIVHVSVSGQVSFYSVDAIKHRNHFEEIIQTDPILLPSGSFEELYLLGFAVVLSGDVVNQELTDMLYDLQLESGSPSGAPMAVIRHASTRGGHGRISPTYLPWANLLGSQDVARTRVGKVRFVAINKHHEFPKFATKELKAAKDSLLEIVKSVREHIYTTIFGLAPRLGPRRPVARHAQSTRFEQLTYSAEIAKVGDPDVNNFKRYFHARVTGRHALERIRLSEAEDRDDLEQNEGGEGMGAGEQDEEEGEEEEEREEGEEEEEREEGEEEGEEADEASSYSSSRCGGGDYRANLRGGLKALTGMSASRRKRPRAAPRKAAAASTTQKRRETDEEHAPPPTQRARTPQTTTMDLSELERAHTNTYEVLAKLFQQHEARVAGLLHETRTSIAEEQVRMEQRMATLGETLDLQIQAVVNRRFDELTESYKSSEASSTIRTIIREEVAQMYTSVLDAQKELFTSAYITKGPTPKKRSEPSTDHDIESPPRLRRDDTHPGRQLAGGDTNLNSAAAAAAPRCEESDQAPGALPTRSQPPPGDAAHGLPIPDQVRAYLVGSFLEGR